MLLLLSECCSNSDAVCIGYKLCVFGRCRYVWGMYVEKYGWKNTLWNASFKLSFCRCSLSWSCVSFASFDVVCHEFIDGVRYVGVCEFVILYYDLAVTVSGEVADTTITYLCWLCRIKPRTVTGVRNEVKIGAGVLIYLIHTTYRLA